MYGMLYSIKNFVSKMSPIDIREGFRCYRTSKYVLNFYETPSGVKYVMNTDLNSQGVKELLQSINSQVILAIYFTSIKLYLKTKTFFCYRFILNTVLKILLTSQEKQFNVSYSRPS